MRCATLNEQAYAISYWNGTPHSFGGLPSKLYGATKTRAMARIYASIGEKNLVDGTDAPYPKQGTSPPVITHASNPYTHYENWFPSIYEVTHALCSRTASS